MEYNFDTISVKKLVWKLGVPAMLAQLFNILYSIVDRIYIGHMASGAEIALASIAVSVLRHSQQSQDLHRW